jgi:hypothetical protein
MRTFSILLLAAALGTAGAPALAQQPPDGTDANSPITILKNMQPEPGGIIVRINGSEIDNLRTAAYDDITGVVKPGTNTLTVTWKHPVQRLNFKIAYAPTRNNFRNVLVVNMDSATDASLHQPGAKGLAFTIPSN